MIDEDAYLRYLDRQRLLLQAQAGVIAQETGVPAGEPGTPEFEVAWLAAISQRAQAAGISSDQASQQLVDAYTWQAVAAGSSCCWATDLTPMVTTRAQPATCCTTATPGMRTTAGLRGRPLAVRLADLRLDDWLAGETAALYGDATFRAARYDVVAYLRPGEASPAIAAGNQPYGILTVTALDHWAPSPGEERLRAFVAALRALRDTVWLPCAASVPQIGTEPVTDVDTAMQTLLELLATSPLSQQIYAREQVGHKYVLALWRFAQMSLSTDWHTQDSGQQPAAAARYRDRLDPQAVPPDRRRNLRSDRHPADRRRRPGSRPLAQLAGHRHPRRPA